ncbi:MAG: ABC transporter substrate-binding protein [bacterium]|nr:hypothetical protein [Planctomycetota bacterium]HIL51056.1 hypothetical protein [Planctomycetota bacterium]
MNRCPSTPPAPSILLLAAGSALVIGCGGGDSPKAPLVSNPGAAAAGGPQSALEPVQVVNAGGSEPSTIDMSIEDGREMPEFEPERYDLNIPNVTYTWDPKSGDASVSKEDGGPGFTGEGWTTNMTFPAMGSAEAVKGGTIHMYITSWPATLRLMGKDYNTAFNYRAKDLCQESLVSVHPNSLEIIPGVATHWKISDDKTTYTFRINPEARWSDGEELTARDVVATWNLRMDERILFPSEQLVFGKMNQPKALSKYIVEVTVKKTSWRNFMYFGGMALFPAREISIPGDEFLKKFQNSYMATSGPYRLNDEDIVMNKSLVLRRRDDWWDADNPAWQGLHNMDAYHFAVIQDTGLAFEKAKKGEIDYYVVPKSLWWVEEIVGSKIGAVRRGLIQKRKFFNDAPIGTAGFALNTTRPPLDQLDMRRVLQFLRNRPKLIDKLFFNEYEPLASYWQGGTYQNPGNKVFPYDPFRAVELLEKMGWTELDGEGYRVKDGRRLQFELAYRSKISEPSLTIYQEDCKRAGIKIDLRLIDPATHWQNLRKREYSLSSTAWGGLTFPNPETSWKGELAVIVDNNNVTAFSDPRVDALLDEYDLEYEVSRRIEIIREIDGIVYAAQPYVLDWFNGANRVIYWNKFKMPAWCVSRTADENDMMYGWWIDPQMEKDLEAAKQSSSKTLETEPILHRFWPRWHAKNAQ